MTKPEQKEGEREYVVALEILIEGIADVDDPTNRERAVRELRRELPRRGFDADNPQRRVGCLGTIFTSLLSLSFFATNTGLLLWWVLRSVVRLPRPLVGLAPIIDWGLPVLALLSVAAIAFAWHTGMRRLSTWESS